MKVLVLGGSGFIGQHLTNKLLNDGHTVTIVDNLSTSSFDSNKFKLYQNQIEFINSDLKTEDSNTLLNLFKQHDKIYHLASSVGVALVDKEPKQTLYNNVGLAHKLVPLLDEARTHVIFSSSSEIYGEGPTFKEEDFSSIGPSSKTRWGYSCSKLLTEFMIRTSDCPHTIVRFFNIVGPGQLGDYGMVLPRFIESAKTGRDLTVYGNGSMVRSFCHINDAVDALIKVSNFNGELFNLGNDQEPISMIDLAKRVITVSGSTSKIKLVPYEEVFSNKFEDILYRVPNLTKLKSMTDYSPKYSLDNIIRDML